MRLRIILFILLACWAVLLPAQQSDAVQRLQTFARNINSFSNLYPQEKVYLHFDNTGYYIGETMWFQSYVVSAQTLQPADLSKVLYVELLSAKGDIVFSKKLKIENGRAPGEFFLKDTLKSGFYEVRAYTRAMLNFGEECVFSRVFPVYPKPRRVGEYSPVMPVDTRNRGTDGVTRKEPERMARVNMTFYPEGGDMVEGLPCKVAFKTTGRDGEDIEVTGTVHNASGEIIAAFTTLHNGMGFFEITPAAGEHTAVALYEDKEYRFRLPACVPSGYSLRVGERQETLTVQIAKTPDIPAEPLGVTFSCRGKVYAFESFDMQERQAVVRLPIDRIPAGAVQITLFNVGGKVLAERLAFVRHEEEETRVEAMNVNATFAPYSPVSVDFQTSDSLPAMFSLSIRDRATDLYTGYTDNATTNLLLSSDLKGYIKDPAWYFGGREGGRRQALDLLMLVQGWRRYDWETMASGKPFEVKHPMEKELFLEGSVLAAVRNRPQANIDVSMWMYSPDGFSQRGQCITDKEGRFNFALSEFYGTWNLSLQTKKDDRRAQLRILLERNFSPAPETFAFGDTHFPKHGLAEKAPDVTATAVREEALPVSINDSTQSIREVEITGKRQWDRELEALRYADVTFDMTKGIDMERDRGRSKPGNAFEYLMTIPGFFVSEQEEGASGSLGAMCASIYKSTIYRVYCLYKGRSVIFVVDNMLARVTSMDYNAREFVNNYDECITENYFLYTAVKDLSVEEVTSVMIDEDGDSSLKYCPHCDKNKSMAVVYIYTDPAKRQQKDALGVRETTIEGYSRSKEFYHAFYGDGLLPETPDIRRTLYWNPAVDTDETGKATVRFYNSSVCTGLAIDAKTLTR